MIVLLAALALLAPPGSRSLEEAVELVKAGRCSEAEPLLRDLLRRDPSPEADYYLGLCLIGRFEHEEAEPHLRRAIDGRRREHSWMYTFAKSLLDRGRSRDALDLLDRALALRDRPEYRVAKAACALELGELDAAQEELEKALQSNEPLQFLDGGRAVEGRSEALLRLGKVLSLRGREEESLAALERAVAADPSRVDAVLELGLAQKRSGRLEEARATLERALAARPDSLTALYGLYQTHLLAGDRERAQSLAATLGRIGALEGEIQYLLSSADSLERTIEEGTADEKTRIAIVEKRLALGGRLVEAGRPEEALEHLLAARRLEPARSETYRRLASLFRLLGRTKDAEMAEGIARGLAAEGR